MKMVHLMHVISHLQTHVVYVKLLAKILREDAMHFKMQQQCLSVTTSNT